MKKIFGFTKKKRSSSSTPDNGSVLSVGYELKDKDLGKVHKAASVGDLTKLKQLAKKNDINQLDKENRTALHIACANGHVELVQFLVESKAKLDLCDNQNRSALMKAVQCQHERCVSILLENHANPNLVDINGNTALHLAANIPSVSTAVLLLQYDAEINSQNKEGFTPLMVAVREDHIEMADFLLKEAAKVNLTDQRQRSSLMIAAGNGQIRMVRLLLQFDADIMLKDASGYSADDYAVMNGHHPCSHLIIEHGTRRTDRASLSNQGQCKKKKVTGTSSQDVEAGFSLGGPAADKDEHKANEAERDYEEDSQSQSLSRVSKSAADEWLSSDDDDESVLVEKKQLKVNLSKMISSKAEAAALHDSSESEQESETRILRIPSQAKASPSLKLLPVDPSPDPLPSKEPQMASTPLPLCTQKSNSSQDEDDDLMDEDDQPVENDGVLEACSPAADAEVSTDKRRDFRSELGLDKHEDEQDSWDSEVPSEELLLPPKEHPRLVTQDQEKATVRDEIKENLLYIPSFLRLDTVSRMEMSEPRRDVGRPGYSQGTDGASSEDPIRADSVKLGQCEENQREKEAEKTKWQALSVLSKLQEDGEQKSEEFMEELGLGDADDLEDASDWDSASTTSRRTLPGRRMTSPGHEDFLEGSGGPVKEQDKEYSPQQSISPVPVPRTRKVDAQKEEEPDWDKITSTKVSPNDDQTVAELPTSSPEIPLKAKHSTSSSEDDQLKQKPEEKTPITTVEMLQTSNTEGVDGQKSEIRSGCPVGEEVHQQEQPMAAKSAAVPLLHLPVHQNSSSTKQEKEAVQMMLQLQRLRAPLTSTHVNGDPFPVFDDSTLSDVSDDEGRLPARERHKMQKTEEVDLAEDFDELTQSSDTATDDIESPTSGYHNASLLIQKLDLPDLEPRTKVKLQNMFYEYERSNQKTRSRCEYEVNKVRQLESEKAELKSSLENIHDIKSALERNQLELQTEVTNLKFHLKQEQENRRNATMMYNTCQDKLRRMEEQHQLEVQERQNVELTLRNHELEMRTLLNNMKQLEEDHIETQRQLAQERSTRALQESLLNNHLRRQQDIEEENQRNMSKSSEALSQLTEATDRERELVQHNSSLQEQLTTARAELQGCLTSSSLKESHLTEEKEALKEQLEDSRRDLKLSNEALSQTVFTCDQQMTQLKTELAMATMRLETERQTCQTLEAKVESTQTCLTGALKEAELCIAARADVEKVLHREKEEHQRLKDRFTDEMASQREAVTLLSQKLSNAEARANSLENEVHRASLQLTEKGVLLDVLQREKDQAAARLKETETALRAEAELVTRARASQEAMQERLAQTQSEGMLLRQQLEESQNKGSAKEQAVTDAQGLFSDILSKVRSDCEERVQLVEDRNKELVTKVADQRDHIYKLEEEKNDREASLRQLQQELADSLKRVSMSEASLEVNTRYRNDLEEEKARLLKDVERLKTKLEDWEDQYVQAEKHIAGLKSDVDQKEREVGNTTQKLQEALSASASSHVTIKQLEEAIQRLEIDNARLEAAAKQQSTKIEDLQKEVREANMLSGGSPGGRVRGHLEVLVTNLQSSKMTLEEQLNSEVQKQSMLSHTAQDSQALWEEELKSRSKLGLHLAELEKEKGELNSQMELEKKKAKKIAEQKKSVDTRLDQEMKRNAELQKEMYRLRTLLKTAKKKLRDQDGAGAEFVSPLSSLRLEQGRHSHVDGTFARMQTTVEDLSGQLEKEASRRSQLERLNEELKDQMASMTGRNYSNEQLERSKKQLEEEVLDLRRRVELAKVEHDQMEHYRRDAEEKARQEVQQKLEQVNLFLQTQAASQEALDRIKSANEVNLRSQLEQRIRELEEELSRAHSSQQDSLHQRESTRIELQRCHTLYADELRVRKSLEAKLERANVRLAEANSKLLGEHSRSLISSSMVNSSIRGSVMPSNHSLGLSFLRPPQGQSSNTDDFLTKMQRELDRSISKELSSAKAELDIATARLSPVGSASRAEADPVSRATQQYLEVLKKNYMI
ncbi:ankyrin repeat domain-containing protein 26 isoform X7 [Gouania willdenowi]|uniref:ankyrin repeat domain-containing protein 26 isoform X7 n=1 Tax=Gouania willdenowi TaxID=441366 RepID=UPI0010560404|nr:ankyrin repeat domain-containing protein 26-like isoform X7 [Gouania willdenowi]